MEEGDGGFPNCTEGGARPPVFDPELREPLLVPSKFWCPGTKHSLLVPVVIDVVGL